MTEINWQELVQDYKADFLEDLFTLLKIDSVRDDDAATEEFPVGPGPVEALDAFLEIGKRDGFETESLITGRVILNMEKGKNFSEF